jgi:O-antigen/teichoic acid export membrane protein
MLRLLRLSLPLGIISMLAALSANIPRYFIEGRLGTSHLGIYSAIASLLALGTLVMSAFGQSIMVPAAKAAAVGDRLKFRTYALQTAALGAVLGVGAVIAAGFFGPFLLAHIFRPEYARDPDIFVWLMGAGTVALLAAGLGYPITAARTLKPQIPLLLANSIATAAASAWLVPIHGLRGAAEAILIGSLVQLAGCVALLRQIDRRFVPSPQPVEELKSTRFAPEVESV